MEKQCKLENFLYFVMLVCFMFPKAVGLTEGQWPMTLALLVGIAVFGMKMISTEYMAYEWILNLVLLSAGLYVYFHNGHMEAFLAVCMFIGMKNVDKDKAIKVVAFIWIPMFVIVVAQALSGGYQGLVGRAGKVGQNNAYVRYSLGYTHPNVLQITALTISMLLLYLIKTKGKRLFAAAMLLILLNAYIFCYSVSFTGLITFGFLLLVTMYLGIRKQLFSMEKIFYYLCTVLLVISPIAVPPFLQGKVKDFFWIVTNRRFVYLQEIYQLFPPTLLGVDVNNISLATKEMNAVEIGFNVDSSFAFMWIYHGVFLFSLFVIGYSATLYSAYRHDDREMIAIFTASALAGTQEQYLGNLSMKNFLWVFIGDYAFNQFPLLLSDRLKKKSSHSVFLKKICLCRKAYVLFDRLYEKSGLDRFVDWILVHCHFSKLARKDWKILCPAAIGISALLLVCYLLSSQRNHYPQEIMMQFVGSSEQVISDLNKARKIDHFRALLSCVVWGCFGSWLLWQITKWFSLFKRHMKK